MTDWPWQPAASLAVLRERAGMLARVRAWFTREGLLEVQTPVLSHAAVSDPALESFRAQPAGGPPLFLHTSPEYAMKRLLAAGVGDCWQVGPVFRDGESGRLHNPEFTMIEWYRTGFDVAKLQHDVDQLLRAALAGLRELAPARCLSYRDAAGDLRLDWRLRPCRDRAVLAARHHAGWCADWDRHVARPAGGNGRRARLGTTRRPSCVTTRRAGSPRSSRDDGTAARSKSASAVCRRHWARQWLMNSATGRASGSSAICNNGSSAAHRCRRSTAPARSARSQPARLRRVALGFDRLVMIALRLPALADAGSARPRLSTARTPGAGLPDARDVGAGAGVGQLLRPG